MLDIFIPSKRSKDGKLFGFVKYKDVTDATALLNKIRSVVMGVDRLFIQEAKSMRHFGEGPSRPTHGRHRSRTINPTARAVLKDNSRAGRFLDNSSWPVLGRAERKALELSSFARREELEWLKRCVIGEVN